MTTAPKPSHEAALETPSGVRRPLDVLDYELDGELFVVRHDLAALRGVLNREVLDRRWTDPELPFDHPHRSGVWRYHELVHPGLSLDEITTKGEGNTRLYRARQVTEFTGIADIVLKHEGENPSGSFKDRGMTVAISQGKHLGMRRVACASTGNTSASMAAYAAAAGQEGVVFIPAEGVALGKVAQALAYRAKTLQVRGDFDAAMGLIRDHAQDLDLYPVNSLNPFRLEGQKTIIWELIQQLRWNPPDWIVVPGGNLGNTSAFGKALVEFHQLGLIDRIPRLATIQAAGASPFFRSYQAGFASITPVRANTVATAIKIGNPVSFERARSAIEATNGVVAKVTDEEILAAKAVVDGAGIGAEPASCASVAGARKLRAEGIIGADERVVGILTGHLLKDPDTVRAYHERRLPYARCLDANVPIPVEPTVESVREALSR